MSEVLKIPCPGCGFKVLEGEYGSYWICPFCRWEDCAYQLVTPLDDGGPNGESLVATQAAAIKLWPLNVRKASADGFEYERDESWRPFNPEEIAFYQHTPQAIISPDQCYWRKSPEK